MSTKLLNESDFISIESIPPKLEELKRITTCPEELDANTISLGIPSFLLNPGLAVAFDLSFLNIGLTKAVYIPRQISSREGGRKSQYRLAKGETTNAGIFLANDGMIIREVTRVTGDTPDAATGDLFRERYLTRDNKLIYEAEGILEITDISKGIGRYLLKQTSTPQYATAVKETEPVWIMWSMIIIK